jgi:hypothetical protein
MIEEETGKEWPGEGEKEVGSESWQDCKLLNGREEETSKPTPHMNIFLPWERLG